MPISLSLVNCHRLNLAQAWQVNGDPVGACRRGHIYAGLEVKVPIVAVARRADDPVLGTADFEGIAGETPVRRRRDGAEGYRLKPQEGEKRKKKKGKVRFNEGDTRRET